MDSVKLDLDGCELRAVLTDDQIFKVNPSRVIVDLKMIPTFIDIDKQVLELLPVRTSKDDPRMVHLMDDPNFIFLDPENLDQFRENNNGFNGKD